MRLDLKEYNGKKYISIHQLRELGFDYPPKGTSGIYDSWMTGEDTWYKFHEKKEGCDGIFISPWLTDIGKKNISEGEFFVEFSSNIFEYKCA